MVEMGMKGAEAGLGKMGCPECRGGVSEVGKG